MIARTVSTQSTRRGDFAGLVKYILNDQGKHERVGQVTVSNCHSDVPDVAILEVLNTQALNTRATACKTYHLIVSFRPGEHPDAATLAAIEARFCDGLGFADHQRVSAVHHDTDNLHVHIAINKIHPTRYTIHDPYRDHKTLAKLCANLERDYGLEVDSHRPQKSLAENRAEDMEHQSGIESLLGWIQRGCLDQIQSATSWTELHQVMRSHGLTMHARGNGLVITADTGTRVKASSIDRTCSKANLEARLGAFEAQPEHAANTKPTCQYVQKPMHSSVDTSVLFARYQRERHAASASRSTNLERARTRKARLIDAVRRVGRLRRAAIKLISAPRLEKKILYALASKSLQSAIADVILQHRKERQRIMESTQRLAWVDWLRSAALAGDPDAIAAWRTRERSSEPNNNMATRNVVRPTSLPKPDTEKIVRTKAPIDGSDKLYVASDTGKADLQLALQIAIQRFGKCLRVDGTAAFRQQVVAAAAAANLPLTFDDADLERQRQASLQNTIFEESPHAASERRRAAGRSPIRSEPVTPAAKKPHQHDPDRIGTVPPPAGRHRLRSLSELDVVRLGSRSEVLLPRDVPRHLAQHGAAADHGVRRRVAGAGAVITVRADGVTVTAPVIRKAKGHHR